MGYRGATQRGREMSNEAFVDLALELDDAYKTEPETETIKDHEDDRGAPCGFCWEMLFAYSSSCQTCKLRPFGSAPCLDDMPEWGGCPGWDCCPNGSVCCEILKHEWPLAEVAINFTKGGE